MRCLEGGGCAGAAANTEWTGNCYPRSIWSASSSPSYGSFVFHTGYLNNGSLVDDNCYASGSGCPGALAFSVRCVLVLNYFHRLNIRLLTILSVYKNIKAFG